MKRTAKLTQGCANSLEVEPKAYKVWDTEVKGFHVKVRPTGTKTYMYFYRTPTGQDRWPAIGRHGSITATQARAMAKEYAAQAAQGHDITALKRDSRASAQQAKAAILSTFIKEQYTPWAQTHMKSHEGTLRILNVDWHHLHTRPMEQITQWDVQKWASTAQREKRLAPSTCQRRITALQGVLSKAKAWGVIDVNPLQGMKQIKQDDAARVRYLTHHEELTLRQAMESRQERHRQERERYTQWRTTRHMIPYPALTGRFTDHLSPLVLLAMNTGMRRGELFSLKWTEVNLSGRTLTIRGSTAKSGKTRHIPLNDEAFATLVAWRNQTTNGEDGLVFPSPKTGERLVHIKRAWSGLIRDAGITDFRFHDLRHHFASRLVMGGVDLNTVRELLGHASLEMTLRYAHLAPEHKAAAVAVLNQ